jgi:hypothetical protein
VAHLGDDVADQHGALVCVSLTICTLPQRSHSIRMNHEVLAERPELDWADPGGERVLAPYPLATVAIVCPSSRTA